MSIEDTAKVGGGCLALIVIFLINCMMLAVPVMIGIALWKWIF